MRRRTAHVMGGALAVLGAIAFVVSCSLGLDESLVNNKADVFVPDDAQNSETAPPDTGSDGPPPITPEAGTCTKDDDCKATTETCLKPHCDVPRKACVFDVCKSAVCTSASCDATGNVCGTPPKTHKFLAATFPVGAGVGCGGAPRPCFAVVYPYIFVGTPNGVIAFSAADPGSTTPTAVTLTGLDFVPPFMMASGSRVYFLGGATGAGASSRVQIAWIDVPADPFRKTLAVQSVLATYNRPVTEPGFSLTLFPRANDTALLVDVNPTQGFPSTPIEPPLVEPLSLGSTALPFTAGDTVVASSGTRLVMAHFDIATGTGGIGLIANAGGTATNGGDLAIPTAPPPAYPVYPTETFANDPQGGVVWIVESLNQPPGPPPPLPPGSLVRAVRAYFLLADGSAAAPDFTAFVDLDLYGLVPPGPPIPQGPGAALVGPAAMIDTKTAFVTTAAPGNTAQTDVQLVARSPLGLVAGKKQLLTSAVGALGAAASNGYGYLLASESATASSVYVFDPACAP